MRFRSCWGLVAALTACAAACKKTSFVDAVDSDKWPETMAEFDALSQWEGELTLLVEFARNSATSPYLARITASNTGATTLEGETGPRNWWFRMYASEARTGAPIWEGRSTTPQDIAEGFSVVPGSSRTFLTARLLTAQQLLGGNPAGTYYVSAALVVCDPCVRTAFFPAGELTISP